MGPESMVTMSAERASRQASSCSVVRPARLMAGSVMITVPVLIVFVFLQRYFVQGISLTGIKG